MNEHTTIPILLIFFTIIGLFIGLLCGTALEERKTSLLKEEAVNRNYAEWKVDNAKTGTTIFTWK